MPHFLVMLHRPTQCHGRTVDDPLVIEAIDALNCAMVDAGVRVFVGGLQPQATAIHITRTENGQTQRRPGPLLNAEFYADGLWILSVATMEEAMAWGQKAAEACQGTVEVRPFY